MAHLTIPKKETIKWTGILFIALLLLFTGYSTLNLYDFQYKTGSNIVHQDSSSTRILNRVTKNHKTDHLSPTNQHVSKSNLDVDIEIPDFSANFNFNDYVLKKYPEYLLNKPNAQQLGQDKNLAKSVPDLENKPISTTGDTSTPKKKITLIQSYKAPSSLSDIDVTYLIAEEFLLQDEPLADHELKLAIVSQAEVVKPSSKSIQQAGIKNAAIIVQTQNTRTNNTSTLQIGESNNSLIEQYTGAILPTGTAHIEQRGDDNLAWQEQYQWNAMHVSQAKIKQSGTFNMSWERQDGSVRDASSSINQWGDFNFAQTSQSGSGEHLDIQIRQQGSGNSAFVTQHSF